MPMSEFGPQTEHKRVDTGRGCMKCREKQLISDFTKVEEGKHMEMRGGIRCCNNRALYSHHAIVDSVQPLDNDGQQATVSLLGIANMHGEVRQETRELHLQKDKVRLIEYNMRKFDLPKTKERANSVVTRGVTVPYRLLTRNCESFATVCVVGNENIDLNLSNSSTQQGRSLFWGVFNCICIGSRFGMSLLSFFLYIMFVAGDNIIDVVPKPSAALFATVCKFNSSTPKGAQEHRICHLKIQSIFVSAYLLYVIIFTFWKCSAKYTCRRCRFKSVLITYSRFLLYLLLEGILIWTEPAVFGKIRKWVVGETQTRKSLRYFVLIVIALVKSAIECALIYWISNFIVTFIPRYLVKKISISEAPELHLGDVITWKRNTCGCSVDAIVAKVHSVNDNDNVILDLIYEECCSWKLFCSKVKKESNVEIDTKTTKVYDFSDFSHKYSPQEVVRNAENKLKNYSTHCGVLCCNRSSDFCFSVKVKNISCEERFNSCERCIRCFCFL